MKISMNSGIEEFNTSNKQIELIESMEYVQGPEIDIDSILKLRSISAFVKRYFEGKLFQYKQVLSINDGSVVCKVFLDGKLFSESKARTFNHSRTQAAILALQDYDFEMLKR